MTLTQSLLAFALAAGLLTVTPGLDTALVLRVAAVDGARRAFGTAAGIGTGLLVWGLFAALGVEAILAASRAAYDALRIAGAIYLVYLGLRLLAQLLGGSEAVIAAPERSQNRRWYMRGLLTNLLNPKVGVFYVSFLPQFVPAGADPAATMLLLTLIHLAESIIWFWLLIAMTGRIAGWTRRRGVRALLDAVLGATFIGFGAKLALRAAVLRELKKK